MIYVRRPQLNMQQIKALIHIVTFNSAETIATCVAHAAEQQGFQLGENLSILITDNASRDNSREVVRSLERPGIEVRFNDSNLGFCGAHNQGATRCIQGGFDALLVLNPDVGLSATCLAEMCEALFSKSSPQSERIGLITPKLMRAADDLTPLANRVIDAAGMILTPSLRHFDRGSDQVDNGSYDQQEYVFGATGACLLISRKCIEDIAIPREISDAPVFKIYPQLRATSHERIKLFDEGFFAYREDADLSWRAGRLGWRCVYVPNAKATHVRVVTPERRSKLPKLLNRWSVRNRFLLQLNNWELSCGARSLIHGIFLRNILVVLGVIVRERSSLPGLWEALKLASRARAIYRATNAKTKVRLKIQITS